MANLMQLFHSQSKKPEKPQREEETEETEETQKTEETANLDPTKIYEFYSQELLPALLASFPILLHRLASDSKFYLEVFLQKAFQFVLPNPQKSQEWLTANLSQLWDTNETIFLLSHFDINGDGHISASELVNITEIVAILQQQLQQQRGEAQNFWIWLSREWPLFDWKLGLLLWRSFGGIIIVLAILSIVPGRLHSLSGKILRWPILILTYLLIAIELIVYIVIRLVIRLAETIVAKPKHRLLRTQMAKAESYEQWYEHAAALDVSQKRDLWQQDCNDSTGYRHNWQLIRQLMADLRQARKQKDSLTALAVLRQCTRKNVGGVMSEDLFSYTNTGEPKFIVSQFIEEVTTTLHWITDEALGMPVPSKSELLGGGGAAQFQYAKTLDKKVREEKEKIWKSVLSWATLSFHADNGQVVGLPKEIKTTTSSSTDTVGSSSSNILDKPLPLKPLPLSAHKQELIEVLRAARAAYGRTALCLSGGAGMGSYHFGHLKGLMETDCLPHIISGTSAGSAVGALVCTRTNEVCKNDAWLLQWDRLWLDIVESF
jgi:hypothetical protein